MKTWYTQPPEREGHEGKNFSSFYCYDEAKRILVRIRLELGRSSLTGKSNDTQAFYNENRYVGFSKTSYEKNQRKLFEVNTNNRIQYLDKELTDDPTPQLRVYDLTKGSKNGGHIGNEVIPEPYLPEGINNDHLTKLADICMNTREGIKLTTSSASSNDLKNAILKAIL